MHISPRTRHVPSPPRASRPIARTAGLVAALTGLLVGLLTAPASAHWDPAYSFDSWGTSQGAWMSAVPDSTPLTRMSIPGTHNTMSRGAGGHIVQNQTMSLPTQLDAGIRFLDIRAHLGNDGSLYMYHGFVYLGTSLDDVFRDTSAFLAANPSETVVMRLSQEHTPRPRTQFQQAVARTIAPYQHSIWQRTTWSPTLGDVRGKIVTMGVDGSFAYPPASWSIKDDYHLTTNWDLYDKWKGVRDTLKARSQGQHTGGAITYLSGSGGSFPYFVASGHSSPGTGAPRLATGLTTPGWSHMYPDFPRVSCFIGICTIAFEGTNTLTANLITRERLTNVGIVVADFPGPSLIKAVIDANRQTTLRPHGAATL